MKNVKIYQIVTTVILAILLTACSKTRPIYNITSGHIPSNQTLATIEETLTKALYSKGWIVTEKKEGEITAYVAPRKHSATIKLNYDQSKYQITYVKSTNLIYDNADNTIHRNYNGWIIQLEQRIKLYFAHPEAVKNMMH